MNETEVLTEANRLVASGLRHAAIDLLREYLESSPDSPSLHTALGRVYLLVGQPEQAVVHLQRSLEVRQTNKPALRLSPSGQDDEFTDDDLVFVDAQAEQQNEIDIPPYDFLPAETSQVGATNAPQPPPSPIAHVAPRNGGLEVGTRDTIAAKVKDRGRPRIDSQDDASRQAHKGEEQSTEGTWVAPTSTNSESPPEAQPSSLDRPLRQPPPSPRQTFAPWRDGSAQSDQGADLYPLVETPPQGFDPTEYEPDSEPSDQPPGEILIGEPEVFLDVEESEVDDEDLSDLVESLPPILSDDEEIDALSWDDDEDLDEFDELAQRERLEQSPTEDTITRAMRARQVAAEVLLECDWPSSAIDLLQQIFIEDGWGAARLALERELAKGLLPEELELARVVRFHWFENERFWTTFQRIKTKAPFMQAQAAYRHMSWAEALRIVSCFPAIPTAEEVIELIEETYDRWYTDASLRRSFKIFLKFLKYRTGSMRGTLPGHCVFDFLEWPESGPETDSTELLHSITPSRQSLWELGIRLPLDGEQPPRNVIRISKEQKE